MAGLALPVAGWALWEAWCVLGCQKGLPVPLPAGHMALMLLSSSSGTGLLRFTSRYNALTYIALFMKRGKVSESLWVLLAGV